MGKSGGRKKKNVGANQISNPSQSQTQIQTQNPSQSHVPVVSNGGCMDINKSILLKRAHELKESGNKRFQSRDFLGALEKYQIALELIPKTHPERAVLHSNMAACLMQIKPIDYDKVISECTRALQAQPMYVRALLRRARAFEVVGKHDMALLDVQTLLGLEPNHRDALEIALRLRMQSQLDLQSHPSPAALGASAVRGAPIGGHGPSLPARPVPKKPGPTVGSASDKPDKTYPVSSTEISKDVKSTETPKVVLEPSSLNKFTSNREKINQKEHTISSSVPTPKVSIHLRPLKLVYGHDIRLAEMPVNCSFKVVREVVSKRFPSSKSVLIKFKDNDGDMVTITCTSELRLAESIADKHVCPDKDSGIERCGPYGILRFLVVEVSPEHEPPLLEEEEEEEEQQQQQQQQQQQKEGSKGDDIESRSLVNELTGETVLGDDKTEKEADKKTDQETHVPQKPTPADDPEMKEVEMDDWLFEFAQLFRTHTGIDPDAHIDLHELGMEMCSEALEEIVTSEDAQSLFDKASLKFQEVAALAYFNWGNVYMCSARKRIPIDDSGAKDVTATQLQAAYEWVKEKYTFAKEKYEKALLINPDFYEGLLALGQQQFEMAKLHWSFVLAKKEDLSKWDPSETFKLFDSAEEKMKSATETWEKLEKQKAKELKDANTSKKEDSTKKKKKQAIDNEGEDSNTGGDALADEVAEQTAVMRSQMHLFWGNMLFERSQVECKLGLNGWERNLKTSVKQFKLAGASVFDISTVLKNHCSNADAVEAWKEMPKM